MIEPSFSEILGSIVLLCAYWARHYCVTIEMNSIEGWWRSKNEPMCMGENRRIKARFDRCRHPISITALVAVIEILLWNTRFCTDLFNGYEVKFRSAICRFGGFGCFCRWFGLDFGCRFSWLIHWFSQIKCWCSHCGGFRTACTHT